MPPRNPTPEDIPLPSIGGPRPVAGYDVSAFGQGGQAIARGVEKLGAGIEKSAQEIAETTLYQHKTAVETGLNTLSNAYIKNRNQFSLSTDPADLDNWNKANEDARTRFDKLVPPPNTPLGAHAAGKADHMGSEETFRITQHRHTIGVSQAEADSLRDIEELGVSGSPDLTGRPDPTKGEQLNGFNSRMDNRAQYLLPEKVEMYKKQGATRWYQSQIRSVIDAARAEPDPEKKEALYTYAASMTGNYLRNQGPTGGAGGAAPAAGGAASIVAKAETGDPTIGYKAISNISPDSKGSKSYGFTGLNSLPGGSAFSFQRQYGAQFGLRAEPGTTAFDAQWKAAALDQPQAFRAAQVQYFNDHNVAPVSNSLQALGIPAAVASDPRVTTYFADRHVQMGTVGLGAAANAWQTSGGDVPAFLRNMNAIDRFNLQGNFRSAIASGVYGPAGHETRLNTRLNGALAVGAEQPAMAGGTGEIGAPQQSPESMHPLAAGARTALAPQQIDNILRLIETSRHTDALAEQHAQALQEKARKAQARAVEDEYLKDAYSDNPQKSVTDVVVDPRLEGDPESKNKVIAYYQRANKPDPIQRISTETTRQFIDKMSKPYGDPDKLNSMEPIKDAFIGGNLSKSDFDWLETRFKSAQTPEGEKWEKHLAVVEKAVRPKITKLDLPLGLVDTDADQRVYDWHEQVQRKKEQWVKEGKNPHDLLDSSKPEYMGSDKALENYRADMNRLISKLMTHKDASVADKKPVAGAPFNVNSIRTKQDVVDAYNAHRITKEQGDQILIDRGWGFRREPSAGAAVEQPHVPVSQ